MLSRFIRKPEVISLSGLGYTQFHEELKAGRFPPPDAWLGPRSPVWKDETIGNWQQGLLAKPKQEPMQTPRRRRARRIAAG
jgi:predicted DNA-binding transcriptional regulator AlpA